MKINIKIIILFLIVVTASVIVGIIFLQKHQGGYLSAEQIKKKFECDRITADYRYSDVFCNNSKFYNDPDSVNYSDFYKYQACAERLANKPPDESSKNTDPGFYNAYYECKDKTKLEQKRQEFIKDLKKLKDSSN